MFVTVRMRNAVVQGDVNGCGAGLSPDALVMMLSVKGSAQVIECQHEHEQPVGQCVGGACSTMTAADRDRS